MELNQYLPLFLLLIAGHYLADFPLQGDFLARGKSRANPIEGVPWYHCMAAHCAIHGLVVGYITGLWWIGLIEFALHGIIDDLKCDGKISFDVDQCAHIACKGIYVYFVAHFYWFAI